MIKEKILSILTKVVAKKHYVCVDQNSFLTSNYYKSGFSLCRASSQYPITIKGSRIVGNTYLEEGVSIINSSIHATDEITIGKCSSINGSSIAQFLNKVSIGNYCSIAAGTKIVESNHRMDSLTTYHYHKNILKNSVQDDLCSDGEIIIEDDVWIGSNAVILSGVHIGRGSIIGAGSIVTKNVEPYSICVGVPARCVKKRFSEEQIRTIEKSLWWEMPPEELKKRRAWFDQGIEVFCKIMKEDYGEKNNGE